MIDFHSHILPAIDDGSEDVEESIKMLRTSWQQGIKTVIATPHFYPSNDNPDDFLSRRQRALEKIRENEPADIPEIILGAEVYYFSGISRSQHIDRLKTEGTSLFLLEMPFRSWSDDMISEMIELNSRNDYTVILAHFERYYPYQHKSIWEEIKDCGIIIQSNAEYFIDKKTRKKAIKHLETGLIDIIGSDCHNTDTRPPNIGEAFDIIGNDLSDLLRNNNAAVLKSYLI